MKDLMVISREIAESASGERQQQVLFCSKLREELKGMQDTELAPYLTCVFDVIRRKYVVTLELPMKSVITNGQT